MPHRPIENTGSLTIVDLDGTLLKGNSLWMLIVFILSKKLKKGDLLSFIRLGTILVLRLFKIISHRAMKYSFHREAERLSIQDMETFVRKLQKRIDRALLNRVAKQSEKVVLATAAIDTYSKLLSRSLGLTSCIATPFVAEEAQYSELRGENKLKAVREYANMYDERIERIVTDHSDDLPLLMIVGVKRLLVNPEDKLCKFLDGERMDYEVYRR